MAHRDRRKFSPTVFIKWENADSGDSWRGVFDKAEDAAEIGERIQVAEYRLVKVHSVSLKPVIK